MRWPRLRCTHMSAAPEERPRQERESPQTGPVSEAGGAHNIARSPDLSPDDGDTDVRFIHVVQKTISPTSRSPLDLLNLPFPFSQVSLLQPSEFIKAAAQRRITMWGGRDLDESGLQELHRRQIIVPFYCVSIADEPTGKPIDVSQSLTSRHAYGTLVAELYRAAADGRLTDPAAESFSPWPTEHVRVLWPTVERGYLYSYHQLLALGDARSIVASLRPRFFADYRSESFLPDEEAPGDDAIDGLRSWRALAVTLSALDTSAWPRITQLISQSVELWRASNLARPAHQLAEWLGINADQLRKQSERLRANASFRDVLGDFYEVVRRAKSEAWESLRGDARCAMDERMAAEILDRFADELEGVTATTDRPRLRESLSRQGLSRREQSLDAVLTDLHLSPHPPLVVALEGKTEMRIVPKVMDVLGIRLDPTWMKFVDYEGTHDLSLLARYAAEPLLGEDHGDFVLLDRPVTRFLILADAENKFATRTSRAKQRNLLLRSITKDLPRDVHRDLYSRGARIVEIVTWGKLPFEFAHFTDWQIADGVLALAGMSYPAGRNDLIARGARVRTSRKPSVESIWPNAGILNLKVALADELWPLLERRIESAIARGTKGPPVMKAAVRAYELAMLSYRRQMLVRRHRAC